MDINEETDCGCENAKEVVVEVEEDFFEFTFSELKIS